MQLFREIFGDRWFLSSVFIWIWSALLVVDSVARAFNGNIVLMTPILLLGVVLVYGAHRRRVKRTERKVAHRLPVFEQQRKEWLLKHLQESPVFMTLCTECMHFDEDSLSCTLHLPGRRKSISLPGQGAKTYCLYWNVCDEWLLLKNDPRRS